MEPKMKYRTTIDWAAIKADYFSSGLSLRNMAEKHGCSHSTIANFAGRNGWVRNADNATSGAQRHLAPMGTAFTASDLPGA